jgi:hypothetical protein
MMLPRAFHGAVNDEKRAGSFSRFAERKGPGACPGLEAWLALQSIAAATAAARAAAIGALFGEVPSVILREVWVARSLRGQSGGEGEKGRESKKGERFHALIPCWWDEIAVGFALDRRSARQSHRRNCLCLCFRQY